MIHNIWIAYYALLDRCAQASTKSLLFSQTEQHETEMQQAQEDNRKQQIAFEEKSQKFEDEIRQLNDLLSKKEAENYSLH